MLVCAALCALSAMLAAAAAATSRGPAAVRSDERDKDDGLLLASRCDDGYFGGGVAVPV